jgi:hypothetical protein
MPRWIDVRVVDKDLGRAVRALLVAFPGSNVSIEHKPPASGPEAEISIVPLANGRPVGERGVVRVLSAAGVSVLAARERLAPDLDV